MWYKSKKQSCLLSEDLPLRLCKGRGELLKFPCIDLLLTAGAVRMKKGLLCDIALGCACAREQRQLCQR